MKKPCDIIRGFIALDARKEISEVKLEHYRLMSLYSDALYGDSSEEERKELARKIDENIARLDEIELKYFGKEV